MSFWSDVYAGDAAQIAYGFWEVTKNLEREPFVVAHVNMSTVIPGIEPNSPECLTRIA
jgi:hypothetical protein